MARIGRRNSTLCWTLALVTSAAPVAAIDFHVDSDLDQIDDDLFDGVCHTAGNTCTLRAAVMQAGVISGAGARIVVPAGTFQLTRPAVGDNGSDSGDLNLATPTSGSPTIEIVGAGVGTTIVDANDLDRVFRVESGRPAILRDLTIRNGFAVHGAGLHVSGPGTTLERVEIRDNTASGVGGGIYTTALNIDVVECTIRDNAAGHGGGIFSNGDENQLRVERSTIFGNFAAAWGGGIYNVANAVIINSTLSGNRANGLGGGLYSFNLTEIFSSTIVSNRADDDGIGEGGGGGVYNESADGIYLRNSIVAGNVTGTPPVASDCNEVWPRERNLLGSTDGCFVFGEEGSWGLLNSIALLGPLTDNGGPTWTHALLEGSNAIDGGNPQGCSYDNQELVYDQRLFGRHAGAACDVGSYEFDSDDLVFIDGFESRNTLGWSAEMPVLVTPDVYRWSDLDLRDPHVYANLPIFGCQDVTDTSPLGAQYSVNAQVQQSIASDGDLDGELDLSKLLAFRPFDALASAGRLDYGEGACAAPSPPSSCDWRMPPVPRTLDYDGFGAGTCLEPFVSTTHGYSPAIATATAPCYVSEANATSVLLLGAIVPLQAARSAATFDANDPPASLSPGLWIGFLREEDADAVFVTVPSLGTAPLSSYLPGGTGNCAAHDDRDLGPDGESGWWVYFQFVASPVSFVGR